MHNLTSQQRFDTVRQNPAANGETLEQTHSASAPRPSTPPADFSVAQEEPHDEHHSFEAPGVIITPPQASEPAPEPEAEAVPAAVPPPVLAPAPVPAVAPTPAPVARTPSIPTPAAVPVSLPPTDDYVAKYTEAQAEIERLRALLATSQPPAELRRRTRKLSDDGTAVDVAVLEETPIQEGVPLQVVVIIALGVFITTYLFF